MSMGSEEYSERPVPVEARLGFGKPAAIWAGFAYATGYTKGGKLTAKAMGEGMPGAERSVSGGSGGPSGTNASESIPTWIKKIESFMEEVFPWMSLRDKRFRSSLGGGLK